jgi:hypothetical protein
MSYYNRWYEDSIRQKSHPHSHPPAQCPSIDACQVDITVAQVTVCSQHNKLVYNLEFKPSDRTPTHSRSNSYANSSESDRKLTWSDGGRIRTNERERTESSQSAELLKADEFGNESMWDDWIVKFIHNEDKMDYGDGKPLEDWVSNMLVIISIVCLSVIYLLFVH